MEQEERMMVYTEEAVVEWADLSNMKDNLGKQRKYEKNEKNTGTNQVSAPNSLLLNLEESKLCSSTMKYSFSSVFQWKL